MNHQTMVSVQSLYNLVIEGTLKGFDARFVSGLAKHDSRYLLSLWETATLKRIADKYSVVYEPDKPIAIPNLEIVYVVNANEMPKDCIGYELREKYDVDEIYDFANMFAAEVLLDKTKVPKKCWVRRNEVFFNG